MRRLSRPPRVRAASASSRPYAAWSADAARETPGGIRSPAADRRVPHRQDQLTQLFQTVGPIAPLIAIALTVEHDLALSVDAGPVAGHESLPHIRRQTRRAGHVPMERDLRIDFVDVLAARASAARKRPAQLADRDSDLGIDNQHDKVTTRNEITVRQRHDSAAAGHGNRPFRFPVPSV